MSEIDLGVTIMTGALTTATGFLAYHAWKLWTTTREIAERDRALKLLPDLRLFTLALIENERCRLTLKNVGYGYATNLVANEIINDGTRSPLIPHNQKEFVEVGDVFNWDIPNSHRGEQKNIEITYTDILNEHGYTFNRPITIP